MLAKIISHNLSQLFERIMPLVPYILCWISLEAQA